jgi:DNA polymerase-3 subunit alpha
MQQLQDVLGKMAKKITIQLPIEQIDRETVEHIENVFKKHKGNQHLNFTIFDKEENLKLTMPSRTAKINISKELLDELHENQCSFKLN